VTYGQLDKVLRSLGFSCELLKREPPARQYEHKKAGAFFVVPAFPATDFVLAHHLAAARATADLFGIAKPEVFDATLLKKKHRSPPRPRMRGTRPSDGRGNMKRTEVTYGQLDKVLRSLGFTCRLAAGDPPARVYDHKETGASIMMPPFPEDDRVLEYHLVTARVMLDEFGIASPQVFEAKLRKAG
jgi:hypothetical protein